MMAAASRALYFGLQWVRREPVAAALRDVRETERLGLDALLALQAKRQIEQLRFAYDNVPYYRPLLEPHRRELAEAKTHEAVARLVRALPVLDKRTVFAETERLTAKNSDELPVYLDKTSGSSGTPLIFPCDQRAWAYRHALFFRCLEAFGIKVGEPYAIFFGLHWNKRMRAQVALRDRILNRVRISAYEVGPKLLDEHLKSLQRARPTHLQGYPSALYDFCALLAERDIDLRSLRLKAVVTTAEPLRPHQRELIQKVCDAPCVNTYGSAEGGMMALECPAGSLHLTTEATWMDVRSIEGRDEIIITDMMLRAHPLIRYAMEDEVTLGDGACSCGRAHPVVKAIEGRAGDPITLPNGRRINANLPSYIFKPLASLGVIRRYRFVQRGNDVELSLVVSSGFRDEHLALVRRETHAALGQDLVFRCTIVDELPHLPNAKHRDYVVEA